MEEEKKNVESALDEKKSVSTEPKDKLIGLLIEMQQEQKKSNKIIKLLLAFSALVLSALFIMFFLLFIGY